jgi:hypothetical protein
MVFALRPQRATGSPEQRAPSGRDLSSALDASFRCEPRTNSPDVETISDA